MTAYKNESYSHDRPQSVGILLTNLGTPDAPTPQALRRYLAEFLWDPRVVEMPRPVWWLILHGIILRTRPGRKARDYEGIWTNEGSPLLVTSNRQVSGLQSALGEASQGGVIVELGMRYGNPSIASALARLRQANARRILVLPLYPQYCAATTGSTFDAVARELATWRWVPELRFVNGYHDDDAYIGALAASISGHWQQHGQPDRLVFSFHGTPRRYLDQGDPYYCFCQKTARLTAERLGLNDTQWMITFQSRFGREEWLQPYTDKTMAALPAQGVRRVDVVCPGFSADCLETVEEIAVENRHIFLEAGGEAFHYIPALNDHPDHIRMLAGLVRRHLAGWDDGQGHDEAAHARAISQGALS